MGEKKHATAVMQPQNYVVDFDKDKSQHDFCNYGDILDPELHLDAENLRLSSQRTLLEFDDIQLSLQKVRHGNEMN